LTLPKTEVELRVPGIAGRLWSSLGLFHEINYPFKLNFAGPIQGST